jgi:hypothetical protein
MTQTKQSAEGRYRWTTSNGKNEKGKNEGFGEVLDLGATPTPRAVLVYGPYTGRGCVSKAAQIASDAALVLNTEKGTLPKGEPIWLDSLERVPDMRIPGISQRIAQNVHMSAQMTHFEQQVLEEEGSPWQFERTLFRTADGAEYHIDVRRVS